jgi:hypothetical protein
VIAPRPAAACTWPGPLVAWLLVWLVSGCAPGLHLLLLLWDQLWGARLPIFILRHRRGKCTRGIGASSQCRQHTVANHARQRPGAARPLAAWHSRWCHWSVPAVQGRQDDCTG